MSVQPTLSRRSTFAALGGGALSVALTTRPHRMEAHSLPFTTLEHPLIGVWLTMVALPTNPEVTVAVPSIYSADGTAVLNFPATEATKDGLLHKGPAIGTWEAIDGQTAHVTLVQVLSDAEGHYLGTVTIDAHPVVSSNGLTFIDNDPEDRMTIRDPGNAIIADIAGPAPKPVLGRRMAPGFAGFPEQRPH